MKIRKKWWKRIKLILGKEVGKGDDYEDKKEKDIKRKEKFWSKNELWLRVYNEKWENNEEGLRDVIMVLGLVRKNMNEKL